MTRRLPTWTSCLRSWAMAGSEGMALPAGWEIVRLGDVAEVVMGQSPPGEAVLDWDGESTEDDGLPFIQGNAEFGSKSPQPLKWCVDPSKVVDSADLLISVRAPVGQTNRADQLLAIGRGLAGIRFTGAYQPFGWHVLNHAKRDFERVAQGSTFGAIGGTELRSLSLALPPLPDDVDPSIGTRTNVINLVP